MTENEPPMDPSKRNLVAVLVIMLAAMAVGYFRAWIAGDGSYLMTWFWIGIVITIVYLLYQVASNVEKLRAKL